MAFWEQVLAAISEGPIPPTLCTVVLPDQASLPAFADAASKFARKHNKRFALPELTTLQGLCSPWLEARIPRRLTLLTTLHAAYEDIYGPQDFSKILPRLERLLADFDEIDSQLLPANRVFKSLLESTEIQAEFADFLTSDEEQAIQAYWQHFSQEKLQYLETAEVVFFQRLPQLYERFRELLLAKSFLYRGLFYREAYTQIHRIEPNKVPLYTYFIGFNKLSASQLGIIEHLVSTQRGAFFQDQLLAEQNTSESIRYQEKNRTRLGTSISFPEKETHETAHIRLEGQGLQTGILVVAQEIEQLLENDATMRALVLLDDAHEAQLVTDHLEAVGLKVANQLPFTLIDTPLFDLLKALYACKAKLEASKSKVLQMKWLTAITFSPLYKKLYHNLPPLADRNGQVFRIKTENLDEYPLVRSLPDILLSPSTYWESVLADIQSAPTCPDSVRHHIAEARASLLAIDEQIPGLSQSNFSTFWQLWATEMRHCFVEEVVPKRPQVMLARLGDVQGQDFDYVFFLHASEGHLPPALPRHSLVPHVLRRMWGLTTTDDDAANHAYSFYRLLKRSGRAYYYLDQASDDLSFAEPSRYLRQLENWQKVSYQTISFQTKQQSHLEEAIEIQKTEAHLAFLHRFVAKTKAHQGPALFPTRVTKYLHCSLQFYLSEILQLKEVEEPTEEMDGARFGNVLHNTMEALYSPAFKQKIWIQNSDIEPLRQQIAPTVRKFVLAEFDFKDESELDGLGYVAATEGVLIATINKLLDRDARRVPFQILFLESKLDYPFFFPISDQGKEAFLRINGKFDRVDIREDGMAEVVDFKTGGQIKTVLKACEEAFDSKTAADFKEAFQIISYAWLLEEQGLAHVVPTVVKVGALFEDKDPNEEDFLFKIAKEPVTSLAPWKDQWSTQWKQLAEEILNPELPFKQTTDLNRCKFCSFVRLCDRQT